MNLKLIVVYLLDVRSMFLTIKVKLQGVDNYLILIGGKQLNDFIKKKHIEDTK